MPEIYRSPRHAALPRVDLRGYLLLPLALPLVLATVLSLARGRTDQVLAELASLGLIGAAVWLVRRSLRPETLREAPDVARRARWLGSGALALGCAICHRLLIGHSTAFSLLIAGLALLGAWLAWWPHETADAGSRGAPRAARQQLARARGQIERLDELARRLRAPQLSTRLDRIVAESRQILRMLEEDPSDVSKARRFLSVYLDGALQVCERYEKTALQHGVTELEENFTEVLDTIARAFAEQRERLLANDVLDLDVQIEVLKRRLELEGIS
ncbi:MAG: 5-bromo-4-chloroindolyl phosphate hydrolysis family protein [Pseudomonadota bacterium]